MANEQQYTATPHGAGGETVEHDADQPYSLSASAETIYDHLKKFRQQVIDVGREMASITIPSVFPPDGYTTGQRIGRNNQSIGALCLNTLASKLMFMALSPYRPVLRYQVIEHKLKQDIKTDPELWSKIQVGLAALEIEHRNRLEATQVRSGYTGLLKVLLVGGNALWEHLEINTPVYHLPTHYVVKRNNQGEQLLAILKQDVDVESLPKDVREIINRRDPGIAQRYKDTWEQQACIYRVCKLVVDDNGKDKYWEYWEEFKGERIPGTEFTAKFEECPLYAAWLIPVFGQNWGRSYCEEYRGDLWKVEDLESALNDGAAAASILWFFLNPGSRTSLRQLKKAENLAMMSGKGEDITTFKTDKQADFAFVDKNLERTIQRLGRAFLLNSSVQRQAERVTAEEWETMTKEIDEAMGGLYSEIGQSVQSHVIRRFVALHNDEDKELPSLPEGVFRVAIISAIDAMGRALEGEALVQATGIILSTFKEAGLARISVDDFVRRIYTAHSVPQTGLVKDEAQVQGEMQQQKADMMKQEVISKAAGPIAGAAADRLSLPSPASGAEGQPPSPQDASQVSPPPST